MSRNFYIAVTQQVLLFGAETWVLIRRMEAALDVFQGRVARRLTGRMPRRGRDGKWMYLPLAGATKGAGIVRAWTSVLRRQNTIAKFIATQPILRLCKVTERRGGTWVPQRLWEHPGIDWRLAREQGQGATEAAGHADATAETKTPTPPFPFHILVSPSSSSSLQLLPCVPLLPPLFLSVPVPASSLSRVVPTIVGGPMSPPRRSVTSQSPRIGRVAMNCATVFCLWRTNVHAPTIPASLVAPARGRYIHFPSLPRRGMRPVSRRATLPWKASRAASILLVSTQVSAPKRRTCCVTAI